MTNSRRATDRRAYPTAPTVTKLSPAPTGRVERPANPGGYRMPATVWICDPGEPTDTGATWSAPILRKTVESFSAAESSVIILEPGASAVPSSSPDRSTVLDRHIVLLATITAMGRTVRGETIPHASTPGPIVVGGEHGEADLVIVNLSPEQATPEVCDAVAATAARLLRVGGVLAVLTHNDRDRGRLIDPTGTIVTSGQSADLLYLQHVVTIVGTVRRGRILPASNPDENTRYPHAQHHAAVRGLPTPHRRIHADLLVFAQPHDHAATPTPPVADSDTTTGNPRRANS